jgi:hypothetical protein
MAALLLQLRLRPDLSTPASTPLRGPLWLNALGVVLAVAAGFADRLHLNPSVMPIAALGAVLSFAVSGMVVLSGLRKRRE